MAMKVSDALIDQLIGDGKTTEELFGQGGLISQLTKRLIDRSLESEISHHLGYEKHASEGNNTGNSRNGSTPKTVKTGTSELDLSIPRDREGVSDFLCKWPLKNEVDKLQSHFVQFIKINP